MDVPGNWWESFFNGVAVDLWLKAIPQSLTEMEADLIVHALQPAAGAELLDVPCGCGRLAHALATRGYRVTGVDLSEESLGHARRAGDTVSWEWRDMRDLPWPARFDGAYCFGNSFGYLDDVGNEAFLRSVAATLKPGGTFVLETPMVAESAWLTMKERSWWKVDDIHLLAANRFDPATGRMDTEYTFVSGGRVEVRLGSHRVYTYRQLVELLTAAGFSDVVGLTRTTGYGADPQAVSGAKLEPYRIGATTLVLIARREVRHADD
jgi:SAM-dependent methyltransferase